MNREVSLDPENWDEFRAEAHAALDFMVDYLRDVRTRPAWRPVPPDVVARLSTPVPEHALGLESALEAFQRDVLPYPTGNVHPCFWAWVCGTGSPVGMVADMLAAGMNPLTLGFDDSAASRVEMQVVDWFKSLFSFPAASSGLLVSGGSMANLVSVAVGRTAMCGYDVRRVGANAAGHPRLVAYASTETHSSVQKALELTGIGSEQYRQIPVTDAFEIDLNVLMDRIEADRRAGLRPAFLIGNAGTVNTGAVDPLSRLADIADSLGLWFIVDGAFGAIASLCEHRPANLAGLDRADALAFDLHKWLHQPYNAGVVLIRHAALHRRTFELNPAYLDNPGGGLSAGPIDFSALGVQLSRSFSALRIWLAFKTYGVERFRALTAQNIEQARYLEAQVASNRDLELLAPTSLNIVNFRFNPGGLAESQLDDLNRRLLITIQKRGIAAPSGTRLRGRFAIRVCICNHRTLREDLDALVAAVPRIARELIADDH